MLLLLLHSFTYICFLTAVTTETVVGVAGSRVMLPCRLEAASQRGVEVCWGRGEPSLFTCHNTVINAAGSQVTYRKSSRYSVSSSSSLSIFPSRALDSGFFHCRVQLPGLFNDQTSTVHLIIISPRSVVLATGSSELSVSREAETLNAPLATAGCSRGSDVTGDNSSGAAVVQVQTSIQQRNTVQNFIGNTVRGSFITFIPALMLTAVYRLWRTQRPATDRRLNQSGEEEVSSV